MPEPENRSLGRTAIGLMMALGTLGQLGLNVVLPSLPAIAQAFGTPPGVERLVLTVFLIGFAGGHLIVGPLADRFGRRIILIPGLAAYTLFGVLVLVAPTLEWMLAARLLQGIGAASGFVIARAIARDAFEGPALFRIFGLLTLSMGIVPGVAPIVGGFLQDSYGWLASASVSAVVGLVMAVMCWIFIPETGRRSDTSLSLGTVFGVYRQILSDRTFLRYGGTNALTLGAIYAYHAGAPEFFIVQQGLSPTVFGWLTGLHTSCFMLGAWLSPRLGAIDRPQFKMTLGVAFMIAICASVLIIGVTGMASIVTVLGFVMLYNLTMGMVLSTGVAAALSPFKTRAGSATALLGATQMTAGAIASALVATEPHLPAVMFPAVMTVMTLLALLNIRRPG